jgi:hypothetical protein
MLVHPPEESLSRFRRQDSVIRALAVACFAMVFLCPMRSLAGQWPVGNPTQICNVSYLAKTVSVDVVQFRSYKNADSGEACMQVTQNGKLLFQRTNDNGGYFTLGQQASGDGTVERIGDGADITGRGYPDMIVSQWTGGAHCCRVDYVFELRPKVRLLAKLEAQDADEAHFADIDGNGRYYYVSADFTFAYWWQSFAGSPSHPVVLRFADDSAGGSYHLALDKMRRLSPTEGEWAAALARVKHELELNDSNMANDLPDVLWQEVLNLLYTGHADLAWKFLAQVGPKAQQSPFPGLSSFCSTFKTSPYWPDLRVTMQGAPSSCLDAKPSKK